MLMLQIPGPHFDPAATGLWVKFSGQIFSFGEWSATGHSDFKAKEKFDFQVIQETMTFLSIEMQSNFVSSPSSLSDESPRRPVI